jgi:cysteine-rich repeat protein
MNANNNDACPDGVGGSCHTAVCGDGFTFNQGGGTEQCDDANGSSLDGCTTQCVSGVVCNVAQYPGGDGFSVDPTTGNCYVSFDGEQTTWAAAETSCLGIGGHLVTITSAAEDAVVLAAQNPAEDPWIGATDDANDTDSVFDWVTDELFGYTHYAAGQPDDDFGTGGNGECLHILNGLGEWNDTNCNFVGFVVGRICEVEKTPCGDGIVEPSETCDDGGSSPSDGCSAACAIEPGWTCSGNPSTCSPNGLWFNEYIEGSSNNKAVEVFNPTAAATSLVGCSVRVYFNGSVTVGNTINLTGTVAPGDVYTLCHNLASFSASCDQTSGSLSFNGDDAVELFCAGNKIDVIGQIGFDPGAEWGTGLTSTADNTLRRKCSVTIGDSNGADVFDPSIQWVGSAIDDFSGVGSPACSP